MFKVGDKVRWVKGKGNFDNLFEREMSGFKVNPKQIFRVSGVFGEHLRLSGKNRFCYPANMFSLAEQRPLSYYLGGT
jgi:hypothetical protein